MKKTTTKAKPKAKPKATARSRARTSKTTGAALRKPTEAAGVLFTSRDKANASARELDRASERAATGASRTKALSEATSEKLIHYTGRAESASVSARRIGELFERLSLVALNAGLEGARLSDHAGRALLLVSEEVRIHTARGGELARELAVTAEEFVAAATDIAQHVERLLKESSELSAEVSRVRSASQDVSRALAEIGGGLGAVAGFDAVLAKHVAAAVEHARSLGSALSAIEAEAAQTDEKVAALRTLAPTLERLSARIPAERGARER